MATKTQRNSKVKKGPGFKAQLSARIAKAFAEGKPQPCSCWDCLRRAGLTPPLSLRSHHPQRMPHRVFGEDVGGEPVINEKQKTDEVEIRGVEGAHLKEAVRNRSAI